MIRINLLPVKELKAEVSRRREVMIGALCLAATIVLIICVYLYQFHRTSVLEQEVANLQTELRVFNARAKDVAELRKQASE